MLPAGYIEQGRLLSNEAGGLVPLSLEVGARFAHLIFVGVGGSWGPGRLGDDVTASFMCFHSDEAGQPCDVSSWSLGLAVALHPVPDDVIDPWISVGAGYEWLRFTGALIIPASTDPDSQPGRAESHITLSGWRLLEARVGADFLVTAPLAMGAFGSFVLGRFDREDAYCESPYSCTGRPVGERTFHEWLGFGIRAVISPLSR